MTSPDQPHALAIDDRAPSFQGLLGVDGKMYSMSSFDDRKVLVIIFMANRCTTNLAYTERIEAIQSDYRDQGVQIVAINSDNADLLPTESYQEMIRVAHERGYPFPYLKDEDQTVAKDYGAILTLHAFLLDQDRKLRYRGRIDDSPRLAFITTSDLRNALDDVLDGRTVRVAETSPFGCAIDVFVSCPSCGSRFEL